MQRTIFLSILFALALVLPTQAQEDEEQENGPPAREVLHCQAYWSIGDTMRYNVHVQDRSYASGKITSKNEMDTGLRIIVTDSNDTGYGLRWQWLISDPDKIPGELAMDTVLKKLSTALGMLELQVRTERTGALISVEDMDTVISRYQGSLRKFNELYGGQMDSVTVKRLEDLAAVLVKDRARFHLVLSANMELFFSPFGMEVLSDSFYTAPFSVPNQLLGGEVPGSVRVELMDVNELTYQVDVSFTPDREAMVEQVAQLMALNRERSGGRGRKVGKKKIRAMGLDVKRDEHYVITREGGWPKQLYSKVRSSTGQDAREIDRTILADVYFGREKNELFYEERIHQDPNDPTNYYEHGRSRRNRGDLTGAIEDQTMALDLRPDYIAALFERALAFRGLQRYSEAMGDLDVALALDSMDADVLCSRSLVLSDLNRFPEALSAAEKAMRIRPRWSYAKVSAAKTLVSMYRFSEAIALYDTVLVSDTLDWNTYGLRADAYIHLRTVEGDSMAKADLDRSLAINPNNYSAQISMGNMLLEREQYAAAIVVFDSILTHREDVTALHNRGHAKVLLGKFDAGIEDLEDALDLEPGHAYGPNNLGWAEHLRGNNDRALEWIDKAIQRQPTNAYAYYNKGRVLLEMNRTDEACLELQKALDHGFTTGYGSMVDDLRKEHCSNSGGSR